MINVTNAINNLEKFFTDVSNFINNNSSLKQQEVIDFINNNFPLIKSTAKEIDNCFYEILKNKNSFNKEEFLKNIKINFDKSWFDNMGFYCGLFSLKSRILEYPSMISIYDGDYINININNFYYSEEQLVFGTCSLQSRYNV